MAQPLIGEVDVRELQARLAGEGLAFDFGAARARVRSTIPSLAATMRVVYHAFPVEEPAGFFDVTAALRYGRGLRRYVRPQAVFVADGSPLFEPFPARTHLPLLEWGLNYLFADRSNDRLVLHAGVVEQGGRAIVLPAMPGSGKSTLTAALNARGFRLLSDEFGMLDLFEPRAWPLLRPVALKNASIDVMRRFAPDAVLGPVFAGTRKGDVAHVAPDANSVALRGVAATPALIVFPQYDPRVELQIEPVPPARAFARLAVNSFNYELLGRAGFETLGTLVATTRSYRLVYRDLDRAIATLTQMLADAPAMPAGPGSTTALGTSATVDSGA